MRPLPIVAGGASGGIVGLCVQVAREIFFSDPVIRVSLPLLSFSGVQLRLAHSSFASIGFPSC